MTLDWQLAKALFKITSRLFPCIHSTILSRYTSIWLHLAIAAPTTKMYFLMHSYILYVITEIDVNTNFFNSDSTSVASWAK